MPATEAETELIEQRRAIAEAFRDGWKAAEVDSTLKNHEHQLNAISANMRGLVNSFDGMKGTLGELVAGQATRDAVSKAMADALTRVNEGRIGSRMFVVAVITVLVMLLGVLVALIALLLHR